MLGFRSHWVGFLGIALMTPQIAEGQGGVPASEQITALVGSYDSSWNRQDTAAVGRLLAAQYRYFTSRGSVWSRAQVLRLVGSPDYALEQAKRSELEVTRSGPVAVVSSRWQGRGTYQGKRFTDDQRCGQVWLQTAGSWQLLSEHCVQIAPKAPGPSNGLDATE